MAIGDQTVDYLIEILIWRRFYTLRHCLEIEPGLRILGVAKEYPDLTVF